MGVGFLEAQARGTGAKSYDSFRRQRRPVKGRFESVGRIAANDRTQSVPSSDCGHGHDHSRGSRQELACIAQINPATMAP